jgi:hypothetical protein
MRRILGPITLALIAVPSAAFAHHDERMLGHHWSVPEYIGEIHVQIAGMAALAGLCWFGVKIIRLIGVRRAGLG